MLDEDHLTSVSRDELYKELIKDCDEFDDINKLFNPSNYLISPFNSTKKFMEEEYFLTEHQEEIRTNVMKVVETSTTEFMALTGAAGTGKTLLTYDIAKELRNKGKRVLIVHCAQLNSGQSIIPKYTPGTHSTFCYEENGTVEEESAHAVIGQEFDKVVAIIDNSFRYDGDGKLIANNEYYSQRQMLYQILTRTRQRLYVIILNNEPMLKRCLEILKR